MNAEEIKRFITSDGVMDPDQNADAQGPENGAPDSDDGWQVVENKKGKNGGRNGKGKRIRYRGDVPSDGESPEADPEVQKAGETTAEPQDLDTGDQLKFKHSWRIWVHDDTVPRWDEPSFDRNFFVIDSVATFLQFFNNFHRFNLKTYSFYVMKSLEDGSYITPTWEHPLNRNKVICSLRLDTIHGIELMQQLCLLLVNESLVPDMKILNGISFSTKTNWALIKIWTTETNTDVGKMLPYAIINSYPSLCVKCKVVVPED